MFLVDTEEISAIPLPTQQSTESPNLSNIPLPDGPEYLPCDLESIPLPVSPVAATSEMPTNSPQKILHDIPLSQTPVEDLPLPSDTTSAEAQSPAREVLDIPLPSDTTSAEAQSPVREVLDIPLPLETAPEQTQSPTEEVSDIAMPSGSTTKEAQPSSPEEPQSLLEEVTDIPLPSETIPNETQSPGERVADLLPSETTPEEPQLHAGDALDIPLRMEVTTEEAGSSTEVTDIPLSSETGHEEPQSPAGESTDLPLPSSPCQSSSAIDECGASLTRSIADVSNIPLPSDVSSQSPVLTEEPETGSDSFEAIPLPTDPVPIACLSAEAAPKDVPQTKSLEVSTCIGVASEEAELEQDDGKKAVCDSAETPPESASPDHIDRSYAGVVPHRTNSFPKMSEAVRSESDTAEGSSWVPEPVAEVCEGERQPAEISQQITTDSPSKLLFSNS